MDSTTKGETALTRLQLAQSLGISSRTLDRWTKRGVIPCVRFGAVRRYYLQNVLAALETKEGAVNEQGSE